MDVDAAVGEMAVAAATVDAVAAIVVVAAATVDAVAAITAAVVVVTADAMADAAVTSPSGMGFEMASAVDIMRDGKMP